MSDKSLTSKEMIQKAKSIIFSWKRQTAEKKVLLQIEELQKALIEQERLAAVGRLARSIGHEFGNVLQPLLTALDVAKERVQTGDLKALEVSIDEMIEAVTLGATICQDLLTFSHEGQDFQPKGSGDPISVFNSVQRAIRLLKHEITKRDIHLDIQVPESLLIQFHEPQLVQVLINLLKNGIEAVPDGGQLKIRGTLHPIHVILEIQDNGIGISSENLSHLFQPLFSTKEKYGNGIGLSTCKQIIETYSGKISIRSQEHVGTTVTLQFPKIESDPK